MMINYLGEDGVAAMTIVLYAQFLLISIYLGFSSGAAPLISYSYGEQNPNELKQLIRYSYGFILVASITTFILSFILAPSIIQIFTGDTGDVYQMTLDGFNLFSISFLTVGINTFASAMFTAFSNGKISVLISTMRTLVLVIIGITILPLFLEVNGIWLTIPFAEIITLFISIFFTLRYRHQYQYA